MQNTRELLVKMLCDNDTKEDRIKVLVDHAPFIGEIYKTSNKIGALAALCCISSCIEEASAILNDALHFTLLGSNVKSPLTGKDLKTYQSETIEALNVIVEKDLVSIVSEDMKSELETLMSDTRFRSIIRPLYFNIIFGD